MATETFFNSSSAGLHCKSGRLDCCRSWSSAVGGARYDANNGCRNTHKCGIGAGNFLVICCTFHGAYDC